MQSMAGGGPALVSGPLGAPGLTLNMLPGGARPVLAAPGGAGGRQTAEVACPRSMVSAAVYGTRLLECMAWISQRVLWQGLASRGSLGSSTSAAPGRPPCKLHAGGPSDRQEWRDH